MEFMDHLYQFGQFGILTFRDGIQEVGGLIPLGFVAGRLVFVRHSAGFCLL